jgi:hypothetical protein
MCAGAAVQIPRHKMAAATAKARILPARIVPEINVGQK